MKITTVKEAIEVAHYTLDNARLDDVLAFLRGCSVEDVLTFMQSLTITKHDMYLPFARAVLDVRLAEVAAKSAQKLERYTAWLIGLTLALVGLTVFLCLDAYFSHHDVASKSNTVSHDSK